MNNNWKDAVAIFAVLVAVVAMVVWVVRWFREKRARQPKGLVGFKQLPPEPVV